MTITFRTDPSITDVSHDPVELPELKRFHNHAGDGDGSGVTVAVMDSGIDTTHDVFAGVSIRAPDPNDMGTGDDVGHGTAVAGLITQLAPDITEIIDLRVFGSTGRTGLQQLISAYNWLFEHRDVVDVVNMSWGSSQTIQEIDNMQNRLIDMDIRDVTAAGNTGFLGGSPATAAKAFGVGACTVEGELTGFSSYNPTRDNPDVTAVGKNVKLARADGTSMGYVLDDEWVMASGTSFSAPITAGYVCRYLSENRFDPAARFEGTARDIPGTFEEGEGIVDYATAISDRPATNAFVQSVPFMSNDIIHVDADLIADGEYQIDSDELIDVFQ